MLLLYAEGREKAFTRLREEIGKSIKRKFSNYKQGYIETDQLSLHRKPSD
jgi:hypothetical protein